MRQKFKGFGDFGPSKPKQNLVGAQGARPRYARRLKIGPPLADARDTSAQAPVRGPSETDRGWRQHEDTAS